MRDHFCSEGGVYSKESKEEATKASGSWPVTHAFTFLWGCLEERKEMSISNLRVKWLAKKKTNISHREETLSYEGLCQMTLAGAWHTVNNYRIYEADLPEGYHINYSFYGHTICRCFQDHTFLIRRRYIKFLIIFHRFLIENSESGIECPTKVQENWQVMRDDPDSSYFSSASIISEAIPHILSVCLRIHYVTQAVFMLTAIFLCL